MSSEGACEPYGLHRLGTVMQPEARDPNEAWGVLNPASARVNNELYLFPRLVAEGNYSRIGIARVHFRDGNPVSVTRLGVALEPQEPYERSERTHGGVEDPRITWMEPLKCWVMAYVAVSHVGPRIALAVADANDVLHWRRLGLLQFNVPGEIDFNRYGNKDGMFFPEPVLDPDGKPALALLHRPTYLVAQPNGTVSLELPPGIEDHREAIWIGYVSLEAALKEVENLVHVYATELLATPKYEWEHLKIGGGTPPIRIDQGWLTYYHGVTGIVPEDPTVPKEVVYSAGALVLDVQQPRKILYRSPQPVLTPDAEGERTGIVSNVVFPTAIDRREDGVLDVYYGQADSRIGAACANVDGNVG